MTSTHATAGGVSAGADPPALTVRNLSKTFQGQRALDDLYITVNRGQVHALLGENGSGKSTLIKVLSGFHRPDEGATIEVGGLPLTHESPSESARLGCRFVHQDLGLIDSLSVADNLAMGVGYPARFATIRGTAARKRAAQELERVGLDLDPRTQVIDLPKSMRTGVAVARALRAEVADPIKLLVLDEPTATMPEDEVGRLLEIVEATAALGVGVLYVTHRLDEVIRLADHITVLRDGCVYASRPAADITREELVTLLVGSELAEVRREAEEIAKPSAGEARLTVNGLAAKEIRDVSFSVRGGEILGIAGLTGSGADTLLPAIFGAIPRAAGQVRLDQQDVPAGRPHVSVGLGLGLLPSDRAGDGIATGLTARENLTLADLRPFWRRPLLQTRSERAEAHKWFERLDVRPAGAVEKPLDTFSGGNQQKIMFARWLRTDPKVLLLAEPTQGVDFATRAALHQRILDAAEAGVAVVISSTDLDEIEALCHRVLVLHGGRITDSLSGDRLSVDAITQATFAATQEVGA